MKVVTCSYNCEDDLQVQVAIWEIQLLIVKVECCLWYILFLLLYPIVLLIVHCKINFWLTFPYQPNEVM